MMMRNSALLRQPKCWIAKEEPFAGASRRAKPLWYGRDDAPIPPGPLTRNRLGHCPHGPALLQGAPHYFGLYRPHHSGEAVVLVEGALAHGRTEEKNLPITAGNASRASCAAQGGACRVRELRRAETAASRLQPLRPLRWARGGGRRQGTSGCRPGLGWDGMRLVRL